MAKENLGRHFSKENIQMVKKYMERCSTSLITREVQIKTTVRYYFSPVIMTIIKKTKRTSIGEAVQEKEPCTTVGGNV